MRVALLWIALLALVLVLLSGCSTRPPEQVIRYVEVSVPVYVKDSAPAELMRKYTPTHVPQFVDPSDPSAVVALTPDQLDNLKVMLRTMVNRDDAWRAWATPSEVPPK